MKGLACLAAQTNYAAKKCLRVLAGLYSIQVCIVWPVYCDQCPHARDNARLYLSPPHLHLLCPVSRACLVLVLVTSSGLHIYLS